MENVPSDAMTDSSCFYGCFISPEELTRGWIYFWTNNELRYRRGERDPDCPPNTYRTDIQRRMPKARSELKFRNDTKRKVKR
jgi:hypothetical protein